MMDGLTVSNSNNLLKTGNTASQLRNNQMNEQAGVKDSKSFADTLKEAVRTTNELSLEANVNMQKLATGETKNIPEVMISVEKASIAFKMLTQVRNKIIDAYQEVMKMQV